MGSYIKLAGDYYLQKYSNLKSNVDKESLYSMTLDVVVNDKANNKQVRLYALCYLCGY